MQPFYPAIATLAAYLIGSLSFAVIVSRLMGLNDPRTYGSGNPGATNVLRSGNKKAAVLTLVFDARHARQGIQQGHAVRTRAHFAPRAAGSVQHHALAGLLRNGLVINVQNVQQEFGQFVHAPGQLTRFGGGLRIVFKQ